jgi:phosphate transport system substrate-binding protein
VLLQEDKMIRTGSANLFFLVLFLACFTLISYAQAAEVVKIGGAGAGLGTMKLLGGAFEKKHPDIKVQVFPSLGSSGGISALSKGALDIVTSVRSLTPEESLAGLVATEYARTPFVFVTHKNVGKDGVTARELEDIYLGKTKNWPDGLRIRLVLRPETDSDTRIVSSITRGMEQAVKVAASNKAKILAVTDQDCTETVSKSPGALGTATLTQILTEKNPLKLLAFEGVTPSLKSLSDGTYRLGKTLYLVSKSASRPAARKFAEFILSREGRGILSQSGNLTVGISREK